MIGMMIGLQQIDSAEYYRMMVSLGLWAHKNLMVLDLLLMVVMVLMASTQQQSDPLFLYQTIARRENLKSPAPRQLCPVIPAVWVSWNVPAQVEWMFEM